jgi:ribonuclease-3
VREIPGIPYRFNDPELLKLALSHRSVGKFNNERLEFLGDSILSAAISARLFELREDNSEGDLSRLRARLVRGQSLAKLAAGLNLGEFIHLVEGEMKSGGNNRKSILADALEAILGAIYLDGGYASCERVILHICDEEIANLPDAVDLKDPKTRIQEWLQAHGYLLPEYKLVSEKGPPHKKEFLVQMTARAAGLDVMGSGGSRQKAEQAAAAEALEIIDRENPGRAKGRGAQK